MPVSMRVFWTIVIPEKKMDDDNNRNQNQPASEN